MLISVALQTMFVRKWLINIIVCLWLPVICQSEASIQLSDQSETRIPNPPHKVQLKPVQIKPFSSAKAKRIVLKPSVKMVVIIMQSEI